MAEGGTDPTYKEWKPEQWAGEPEIHIVSTDPTYKEWKLFNRLDKYIKRGSTDPTYKEWKRNINTEKIMAFFGTDPTYKEWKQISFVCRLW